MNSSRDEGLRDQLQRAAAAHTPDRTVMLNRIAAARARRAPRLGALRLAGAALAVAAVLGVGGVARWALLGGPHPPAAGTAAAISSPSSGPPSSGAPSSGPPSSGPPSSGPPASTPGGAVRGHPGDTKVENGTLWSDGSVDPDSTRSVVTLKASAPLTALDLTIRVAVTPGLSPAGTAPAGSPPGGNGTGGSGTDDDFVATVTRTREAVLYRFVLRTGVTLNAGTYTFTARYSHAAGGRDAGGDTYEAVATDATHHTPHVYGNFYPTR